MRYPASEKLEIIRLVERSHLSAKKTLDMLGVARPTFYRWYDLYQRFGEAALEDGKPGPQRAWNRVPEPIQKQIVDMALEHSELSPRELAVRFTDERRYFVSEATVYRLRKAHDLITIASRENFESVRCYRFLLSLFYLRKTGIHFFAML